MRLFLLMPLLGLVACQMQEPKVVKKTVYTVKTVSESKIRQDKKQQLALQSPAEMLDPFYVRLQFYQQIESEINAIYDVLEQKVFEQNALPELGLSPVKGVIKGAKFQTRANEIISEYTLNRIENYQSKYSKTETEKNSGITKRAKWTITPEVNVRLDKVYLKFILKDHKGYVVSTPGASAAITDYFFYNYVDGIRY